LLLASQLLLLFLYRYQLSPTAKHGPPQPRGHR
jgi:hypothetical protein